MTSSGPVGRGGRPSRASRGGHGQPTSAVHPRAGEEAAFLDDLLLADTPGSRFRLTVAFARSPALAATPEPCLWGTQAWQARARGDGASADRLMADGLGVSRGHGAPGTECGLLALAVELAALRGDRAQLRTSGEALRKLGDGLADRRRLVILERALGMDAMVRGDLDSAYAHLSQAADVPFLGRGLRDPVLPSRVDLVAVLVRRGDEAEARVRRDAVRPLQVAMEEPLAEAYAARAGTP